ncbi:MAG: radical SAM family heme chaperone HemW [Prevotellaceae bacterium]|nr:radical SAM family heme chaperone HemW [Prevotellaceae bacterium]
MAGIYLHIPFCKTRCSYCDFYSTTRAHLQARYVEALCRELRMRGDYLQGEPVRTLYFGGGTPSRLSEAGLSRLFQTIEETYGLDACEEITLEANPDDLTQAYVSALRRLPFNRISIGIQTFHDPTLRLMNRRHTAAEAIAAVARCRQAGFGNISIDLIYGLPGQTEARWQHDLDQALALQVEHISAYHLTYEEGTPLHRQLQAGSVREVDEACSLSLFTLLMDRLAAAGYEHYEISNFCLPGKQARHNTAYWQGIPYLGCGPSAHSYNRTSREWNIASLDDYLNALEKGERHYEREQETLATRYNECVMTALRTRGGLSLEKLKAEYGETLYRYCLETARPHVERGLMESDGDRLRLTRAGLFISDGILADLMYVE